MEPAQIVQRDWEAVAVSELPDHFVVLDTAPGSYLEPSGPGCRNPLADPWDGTRLVLVKSGGGYDDVRPSVPGYGLERGQLLRVRCSDGRPLGATSP